MKKKVPIYRQMLGKRRVIFDKFFYRNSKIFIKQQATSNVNSTEWYIFDSGWRNGILPMISFLHDQGAILDQWASQLFVGHNQISIHVFTAALHLWMKLMNLGCVYLTTCMMDGWTPYYLHICESSLLQLRAASEIVMKRDLDSFNQVRFLISLLSKQELVNNS